MTRTGTMLPYCMKAGQPIGGYGHIYCLYRWQSAPADYAGIWCETENLKNSCIETEAVAEIKREAEDEIPHMDKQQVLEFLQEVLSPGSSENSDPSQDSPITSYPEYDEIIRQYYNGVNANWSMSDYSDRNLCYLAGYEMSSSDLGYCTMDIDGDGIEE